MRYSFQLLLSNSTCAAAIRRHHQTHHHHYHHTTKAGRCLKHVETSVQSAWFRCFKLGYDEPLSNFAFNRPVSVYRFPRRALTLCPQLCMSISPRRYTEIGLFQLAPLLHQGTASPYSGRDCGSRLSPRHQNFIPAGVFRTSTRPTFDPPPPPPPPTPPPRVSMNIHPGVQSCSISARVLRGFKMRLMTWRAPSSSHYPAITTKADPSGYRDPSNPPADFWRFRTSESFFWVILLIRRNLFWV